MPPASPKLLAVAYACSPGRGSEWGLGWSFVREMARHQPIWVITHAENQPAIDPHLAAHPPENPIHVTYVTMPAWVNWFGGLGYTMFNIQYYLWNFAVARAARRLHAIHKFDVVQHVSLMRWWMPTGADALAPLGAAFIFGPVGGGELVPKRFRSALTGKARLGEMIRKAAVKFWCFDPLLLRTVRRATLVLAGTPQTAAHLAPFKPDRMLTVTVGVTSSPEILDAARAHRAARPPAEQRPFRIVSSGGLSYFRGVDLAIRAFAKASLPDAEYVHASDGPGRPRLEQLARELGIADRVKFLGDQPHAENVKVVASADIYVHTVLRDSMGLMPDALSLGIPILTLDHNTMAVMVDETVGHKVPMGPDQTPQGVIDELAEVMKRWHADPELRRTLGARGIASSGRFTPAGRNAEFRECINLALTEARRAQEPAAAEARRVIFR